MVSDRCHIVSFKNVKYPVATCEFVTDTWGTLIHSLRIMLLSTRLWASSEKMLYLIHHGKMCLLKRTTFSAPRAFLETYHSLNEIQNLILFPLNWEGLGTYLCSSDGTAWLEGLGHKRWLASALLARTFALSCHVSNPTVLRPSCCEEGQTSPLRDTHG